MKGPAGPSRPPRPPPGEEDSNEATAPGLARAPQSPRALALLDDEVTVARESDAHAHRHERAQRPRLPPVFDADPLTLPVDAPPAVAAPSPFDESTADLRPRDPMPIHRVPALLDDAPPSARPRTLPPPAAPPRPQMPAPPPAPDLFDVLPAQHSPPPVALPAPRTAMAAAPEVDDESVDRAQFMTPLPLPCTLRAAISWRKANPGNPVIERVAIAFTRCLGALHQRSIVLGERIVPENFNCLADGAVEYLEALDPTPRSAVEQYLAPELFRGREATAQTDVFGAAAVVYELLVGRSLKPAFLPQVAQTTRTDTWFSDPGASLPEPYRLLLRPALSDRAAQRHPDMATFSAELFRAWRLVHNPERRVAVKEAPKPFFTRAVKIGIGVATFLLFLAVLAFFPIDQLTAPPVPTVQPSMGP